MEAGTAGMDTSSTLIFCFVFFCVSCAGWLVDAMKDYSNAFYLSGFCLILSAVFVALVDHLVQRRKVVQTEGHQVINQED